MRAAKFQSARLANGEPLGGQGVLAPAEEVLKFVASGGDTPILILVDTQG